MDMMLKNAKKVKEQKQNEELLKKVLKKILLETVSNTKLRKEFKKHPKKVLKEYGVVLEPKKSVKVIENTKDTVYIQLLPSSSKKLTPAQLKKVGGGEAVTLLALVIPWLIGLLATGAVVGTAVGVAAAGPHAETQG